jgi:hypothetical protein
MSRAVAKKKRLLPATGKSRLVFFQGSIGGRVWCAALPIWQLELAQLPQPQLGSQAQLASQQQLASQHP